MYRQTASRSKRAFRRESSRGLCTSGTSAVHFSADGRDTGKKKVNVLKESFNPLTNEYTDEYGLYYEIDLVELYGKQHVDDVAKYIYENKSEFENEISFESQNVEV